jgi:glycosyltransferase involved in cell wall biosynthesis
MKVKTRVMLLTSSLAGGGAERVIATLVQNLDRRRFEVTIAHLKERGGIGQELAAQGYDVVGIPRTVSRPGRYLSFRALGQVVQERGIQLVHTHTTYALTDAALCRWSFRRRVRLVHTFHFGNYPNLPMRYRLMERVASRTATHLVAVGQEQRKALQALYGIPAGRISTILNGTDCASPAPDPEWAARLNTDARVVIGTTATFIEQKGLDHLLDVAAVLRQQGAPCVFVVTGDGPLRTRLEARRHAMGLDEMVLFAGWKENAGITMTPLYDVLFQPSLWEAMSVVVIEAMGASKPVVATDVGDNRHVVQDGTTGFIVPPRDVAAMAARLSELIGSDRLRAEFGAEGRRAYERGYTAGVMTQAYEDLYDRLLHDGVAVASNPVITQTE